MRDPTKEEIIAILGRKQECVFKVLKVKEGGGLFSSAIGGEFGLNPLIFRELSCPPAELEYGKDMVTESLMGSNGIYCYTDFETAQERALLYRDYRGKLPAVVHEAYRIDELGTPEGEEKITDTTHSQAILLGDRVWEEEIVEPIQVGTIYCPTCKRTVFITIPKWRQRGNMFDRSWLYCKVCKKALLEAIRPEFGHHAIEATSVDTDFQEKTYI